MLHLVPSFVWVQEGGVGVKFLLVGYGFLVPCRTLTGQRTSDTHTKEEGVKVV